MLILLTYKIRIKPYVIGLLYGSKLVRGGLKKRTLDLKGLRNSKAFPESRVVE